MYFYFSFLETEQSKGGEGRDPGECGQLPEGREGAGEGSPAPEESPVQGAETHLRPPAQLPRHEVLSAEGQPLYRQPEPGVRGQRRGYSSSRGPDTTFISRAHPQGPGRSAPSPPAPRSVSSVPHPEDRPAL